LHGRHLLASGPVDQGARLDAEHRQVALDLISVVLRRKRPLDDATAEQLKNKLTGALTRSA
jgi:hypothetical protein